MKALFVHLKELVACRPAYITCTYGAGGSSRERTLDVLAAVHKNHPEIPLASHLTCIGSSVEQLRSFIVQAREIGITHIVALRGDLPKGEENYSPPPDGLHYANELVSLIKTKFPDMGISVGGYPETHPEAPSTAADIENLKRKVDAGADFIVTQLFFDNADYFRFRDRCDDAGISVPIIPGILPLTNLAQAGHIVSMCNAHLSSRLVKRLEVYKDDKEGQHAVGVYYAARQAEELIAQGVPGIHFYVLNKSRATVDICRSLALFTPVD